MLVSELRADQEGVIWLGEDREQIAVVHGRKAGIILRGEALEEWKREGQKKWLGERVATVTLQGLRLVAAYQPIWGRHAEDMEVYRRELEQQVGLSRGRDILVIGGDFNANIGAGRERRGVCGNYGIGPDSVAGEDLVNWCEGQGLAWVNSFMGHGNRGTWFSNVYRRWYELDGFIVKREDRHKLVRKMMTMDEKTFSDHKPKLVIIRVRGKRWRDEGGRRERAPNIKWEVFGEEEKRREFEERTREKFGELEWDEEEGGGMEYGKVKEVVLAAAE